MSVEIGTHATKAYPQDMYPMVVVKVSESGKTIWLDSVLTVNTTTGHAPAYYNGPWPVWDHKYTDEEVSALQSHTDPVRATLRKDGTWKISGTTTPVTIGAARYYRNFSY